MRPAPKITATKVLWAIAGVWALSGCAAARLEPAPPAAVRELSAGAFAAHVALLADESLGGRMTGTAGNDAAAEYIAGQFAQADLKPGGPDGTWYQWFPVSKIRTPGPRCALTVEGQGPMAPGRDFSPMAAGTGGPFDAPLVFAGYGLRNRVRGYDDYARVSARGSVVMVLQGEPHDATGQSKWALPGKWTRVSSTGFKLKYAARRGAVAVLLVTPPAIAPRHDPLYDVLGRGDGPVPAMRISRAAADRMLGAEGSGKTVAGLVAAIHRTGKPASLALGKKVAGVVDLRAGRGRNVIGVLPAGAGSGGKTVVLCAHYDHIPASGQKAADRGFGVRPGADDNASGTAALILLARALARAGGRRCTYVFIACSGEEIGLLGSRHFTAHPTIDLARLAVTINFDQIGFVRNGKAMLIGRVLAGPVLRALRGAQAHNPGMRLTHVPMTGKVNWSDQAPFARVGSDTLFFHAGRTRHYHSRTDTADRLNNDGAACLIRLAFEFVRHLDVTLNE